MEHCVYHKCPNCCKKVFNSANIRVFADVSRYLTVKNASNRLSYYDKVKIFQSFVVYFSILSKSV